MLNFVVCSSIKTQTTKFRETVSQQLHVLHHWHNTLEKIPILHEFNDNNSISMRKGVKHQLKCVSPKVIKQVPK